VASKLSLDKNAQLRFTKNPICTVLNYRTAYAVV